MRRFLLAALMPLAACGNFGGNDAGKDAPGIPGSGTGSGRSFAVADFTAVDLRGSDDVDIRVGAGFSVRAEGDTDVLEKLKIERVGSTLRVGRIRSGGWSWGDDDGAKIFVTMPRLIDASVAGSGDMAIDRVEGSRFSGAIAGSGSLAIGALAVDEAKLEIAGSGDLKAAGRARSIDIDIAGSGDVEAPKLTADSAKISIAGSGNVRAIVDGPAKVSIAGSGDVVLGGKARCDTSAMGSGTVRCGG